MKKTLLALLTGATLAIALPAAATEPSLHEVYQAADAGRMDDAQRMVHEVLQAHPNSGKAHYVEAELLCFCDNTHARFGTDVTDVHMTARFPGQLSDSSNCLLFCFN